MGSNQGTDRNDHEPHEHVPDFEKAPETQFDEPRPPRVQIPLRSWLSRDPTWPRRADNFTEAQQ